MIQLLLVGPDEKSFSGMTDVLTLHSVSVHRAENGSSALSLLNEKTFDLVVTDQDAGDMTGLEFAEKLIINNPMINCAAVSRLSPEKFHEVSEGMGVMAQLPLKPGKEHAGKLLQRLRDIKNLMSVNKD